MKIEGKGNNPNQVAVRSAIVETPDIISSFFTPSIKKIEDSKRTYINSVKSYSKDALKKFNWIRGGGERNAATNAATKTDKFVRKHPFKKHSSYPAASFGSQKYKRKKP